MLYATKVRPVDPITLARQSGITKPYALFIPPPVASPFLLTNQLSGCNCGAGCLGTLGAPPSPGLAFSPGYQLKVPSLNIPGVTSVLQTIGQGLNFIPGAGPIAANIATNFTQYIQQFETWLGIGAGRREADLIVPVQNDLVINTLGHITDQFRVGQNPTLDQLKELYRQVWMAGVAFMEFVLQSDFTDRRASGQALNTVMPYIDGTCGYAEPIGPKAFATRSNCITWGTGQIGGNGTDGMLGTLARAIQAAGGTVQDLPSVQSAANEGFKIATTPEPTGSTSWMTIGLVGAAALFLWSRK